MFLIHQNVPHLSETFLRYMVVSEVKRFWSYEGRKVGHLAQIQPNSCSIKISRGTFEVTWFITPLKIKPYRRKRPKGFLSFMKDKGAFLCLCTDSGNINSSVLLHICTVVENSRQFQKIFEILIKIPTRETRWLFFGILQEFFFGVDRC